MMKKFASARILDRQLKDELEGSRKTSAPQRKWETKKRWLNDQVNRAAVDQGRDVGCSA